MKAGARFSPHLGDRLTAYRCAGTNPLTGRDCHTVLIEAWAPEGAIVRRRCKRCGSWQVIEVEPPDPVRHYPARPVLD